MIKLFRHLEKQHYIWFLIITSVVFFLLRLPSFFEPYWYGDEGIYEVIGFALNNGRQLYTGIWDNKPPLLYIVYGLFDGIQPLVRIASFLAGLGAVFVFYFLAKKLFEKHDRRNFITFLTTAVFAFLFATPLIEGNIANAENFMVLPILLSGFLILRFIDKEHEKKMDRTLLMPGLLLGIAFLFKVVAVFDFGAFFLFLFIINYKSLKKIAIQIPPLLIFSAGFFIPFIATLFYFLLKGEGSTFIQSAFLSNVGYVGYGNKFIIPQGLLILKLILLGGFVSFLFGMREKISRNDIFISLWLAFSIFNVLFSQRAYTHYVLVLIAAASLSIGLVAFQKKYRVLIGGIVFICLLLIAIYFSLFTRISKFFFGYYGNYISFFVGQKSVENYIGFFDKKSVRDYNLSNFLKTALSPNDNIFIWGNNGQLYRLAGKLPPGRFIVAYHITASAKTITETSADITRNPPQYIILMPEMTNIPLSMAKYKPRFVVDGVTIYEKVL